MSTPTQAALEARLLQRWALLRSGAANLARAFGGPDDWTLTLERHRLLLHPGLTRWLRHDRVHGEWHDTGVGPGEALLLVHQGRLVMKRLPEPLAPPGQVAAIGDWCVWVEGERLVGPVRGATARAHQESRRISCHVEMERDHEDSGRKPGAAPGCARTRNGKRRSGNLEPAEAGGSDRGEDEDCADG